MNHQAVFSPYRQALRREAFIFAGLTAGFWICASFFKKLGAYPAGLWLTYVAALLFITLGFMTIFRTVVVRVKEGKNRLITGLGVLAAFLFFSIGGPLLFAWLSLRTSKETKA